MAFLKGRLRRKSSERSRATSIDVATKNHKSESSPSICASVADTGNLESINIEVEQLFQQATDTDTDHPGRSKTEPSVFLKIMKRKGSPTKPTGLKEGLRRSFSHRERPQPSTESKSSDRVQNSSPDFVSEMGYDSDALFIPSPRFSEQSWDSAHPCSPIQMERTMTSLNQVLANDLRSQPNLHQDNETIALPVIEPPKLNDLSILKRRRKIEFGDEQSSRSYTLRLSSITPSDESGRSESSIAAIENRRKKSRFNELFHLGLKDDISSQQPRKVSIGWMSGGKRCGYGYSFVEKEEATNASCTADVPPDDSSESLSSGTEDWQSTRDVVISDDSQDNDEGSESKVEISSQVKDEESAPKPERISSPSQRLRWTIFPSHTKAERNLSMNLDNGIIVRDFCPKASPDRPQLEQNGEEKKHHLISHAIRQGFHDTFLWVIGLRKREIARYHAGLEVHAARSHECMDPPFETTVPYWDNVPKEELGDYHIEAWRAAKRREKKRSGGKLGKFRVSMGHSADAAAKEARKRPTSSCSSSKKVCESPLSGPETGWECWDTERY
ncbi:conserved hypothetical protein [Talaromyces stipitatus ATCC 10500]|uniref:Uncharacterized protein n=1 Tax=Talaromyces stipitatus (strain ATCC 10500 / CBS 375.48 / QM 6759 / NRRL 1006) TaxID=441959 RepID=B8LTX7_TALSN|nr:uncharacterized protein TSTA_072010 [Talaromyces stipitatus ATCC 10500]EED23807.1 conserved hypothetical protein [Talaromyces stipitatus ATCC 10500]